MKRHLPVIDDSFLDNIKIATPCSANWDEMSGDARVRHCSDCRLNVYDVSQMTRKEAAALIVMNEGQRTCMKIYRRPDGTLITQDCWERLRAARQRGWGAFAVALVIVCFTQLGLRFAGLNWLIKWYDGRTVAPIATMGDVAPIAVPPPAPAPIPTATPPELPHVKGEIAMPVTPKKPPTKPVKPEPPHVKMGKIATPMMGDIAIDE